MSDMVTEYGRFLDGEQPVGEHPDITIARAVSEMDDLRAELRLVISERDVLKAQLGVVRAERDTARVLADRRGW